MDHAAVNAAVVEAVRSLGRPYEGPIESASVDFVEANRYSATFNDTRKSHSEGPVFSCDIEISEDSTHESVRDYVRNRILQYFADHP